MDLQELFNKWNIKCDAKTLLSMWNESHRYYHNLNHLNSLIERINIDKSKYSEKEYEKLILTACFHDCVYDPTSEKNEENSANFLMECSIDKDNSDINEVRKMILDTKNHKATTPLSENFIKYDMSILESDFEKLLDWEGNIREEYKMFDNKIYKEARLNFLESIFPKYPNNMSNLIELREWVKNNY